MAKKDKIILAVAVNLVLLVALVFAFGFIIGGKPQLVYVLYSAVCSAVLSTFTLQFVFGKNGMKSSKKKSIIIFLTVALTICMYIFYGSFNRLGADREYKEYSTKVDYFGKSGFVLFGDNVRFYNQQGELVKVKDYTVIWEDDEAIPVEGSTLTVREYSGMFNYPKYEIVKVNGK